MCLIFKDVMYSQFGASIDMLKNAIQLCPDAKWDTENKFWYTAYHTLFFLDYYLTLEPIHFVPPPPFTLSEFEDEMPDRVYSKAELLTYLTFCKAKLKELMLAMTDEVAQSTWINESKTMSYSVAEILLYNMRHVQHHAGQLNLILRQEIVQAPEWVRESEDKLP